MRSLRRYRKDKKLSHQPSSTPYEAIYCYCSLPHCSGGRLCASPHGCYLELSPQSGRAGCLPAGGAWALGGVCAPEWTPSAKARRIGASSTGEVSSLTVAGGGRRHLGDIRLGIAMATLYLLLPCTAYQVNQVDHVLPAALVVWSLTFYHRPMVAGGLMGLACGKPFDPADEYKVTYYAPQPRAVVEVVEFDDHNKVVGYGETGRVKLYTLTKELFVPGFLERDEGEREEPHEKFPWDGVSGVRPYHVFAKSTTVGVY